jgi:hypothetical protein
LSAAALAALEPSFTLHSGAMDADPFIHLSGRNTLGSGQYFS